MATITKARLEPYRVARRARTRIYLEGAGQVFKKGDLLKADTSAGKNRVILAGADETRILGMADEDATGTADAEISVIIAHVDDEWVGNVSGTLDRTHLDQDFGIIRDSAGIWLIDLSDTVNTRVRVVKLIDEHGDVNGRAIFTWIATNNVYGVHVAGATQTLTKQASAPGNPGTDKGIIYLVPGTTGGTVRLAVKAGTGGAEAVVMDDIPQS